MKPQDQFMRSVSPWLEALRRSGKAPRTIAAYRYAVTRFALFARGRRRTYPHQVRVEDLEAWSRDLTKAELQPVTRLWYLQPVIAFFTWLERTGAIFLNPARGLLLPDAPRHLLPVPSEADMRRVLESLPASTFEDVRDRALLETAYATGLRLSELTGLHAAAIDFDQAAVRVVGKGAHERIVPLTIAATRALGAYRALLAETEVDGSLWRKRPNREPMSAESIRAVIVRRTAAAGTPIRPHAIRRAFATHLLRNGANPLEIMLLLGHRSLKHLRHYLRYTPMDLIAAHRRSRLAR